MSELKHNPTPWSSPNEDHRIFDANGVRILSAWSEDTRYTEDIHNAHHAVACVNACKPLAAEALEQGALRSLIRLLFTFRHVASYYSDAVLIMREMGWSGDHPDWNAAEFLDDEVRQTISRANMLIEALGIQESDFDEDAA